MNCNTTYGNTAPISSGLGADLNQPMSFSNPGEGFWTPVSLLGSEISGGSREWNGLQLKDLHNPNVDNQDYGDTSLMNFPLSELGDVAPREEASAEQTVPAASSFVASQGQSPGCNCISVLANSLERINSDTDNDVDESEQLDHLLMYLHDGIETCKKVKLCKRCSVYTTNSMVVVTLIQQLAVAAQTLSSQLVNCQQRVSKISSIVEIPQTLRADIRVGEHKVQATSLHLKFLFPIAGMYLKDLQQLIQHLQDDMKKGPKTVKMLSAVADTVRKAGRSLQA
ncbi:hypothetical protein EKO04_005121 [Ascochyta lentis]|uniref:Uncharacterized protein n=1 Tax=Ascochyta lentis TaxID=205686 RepID=A0A8H7J6N6_9PLEO|nr:hypothetical protein EKO04_005121 [Ascochyta lentis]